MEDSIGQLVAIANGPIGSGWTGSSDASGLELLLGRLDGFYAFEGALHVRSWMSVGASIIGVADWNAVDLWRGQFKDLDSGTVFFAEDIFGCQFGLDSGMRVVSFDPEIGEIDQVAESLEEWARAMLDSFEVLSGHPLAHAWQMVNGPIAHGCRLIPVTPFVLGGEFSVANLRAVDAVEGMLARANLAKQIHGLPDGTEISYRVT